VFTKPQFKDFASALADHGVEIKDCHDYAVKEKIEFPLSILLEEEISGTHSHLCVVRCE
jgi:RNA-dependent RNA polymerase